MSQYQEICVFFPCHTLEDFPTHLRDTDADGLLVAWTVPWHPRVLAGIKALPTWYRADTPPVDLQGRVLLIPTAAESRLPRDLSQRVSDASACRQISVTNRMDTTKEILALLPPAAAANEDLAVFDDPTVAPFFALGYAALQVQTMTRKLRYSSNLDLVTFGEHAVAAAEAWCQQDAETTSVRLQAAFDLLAEERDHYFSSDPHLIDLVLVAESTLGPDLADVLTGDEPLNLLLSAEIAQRIADQHPQIADRIRARHAAGTLSIAGGAPSDTWRLDYLSSSEVLPAIRQACADTEAALGVRPRVFARVGGGIPGDLPPWLVAAGMVGAITNDFSTGNGSQSEAKLLWQSGGAELEALTAIPQDVTQPQTFLGLGPKLGEAADSGQVAAALLVRWPGQSSPYLDDLRGTASKSLALGRFWTLDDFFTKGERPYHCCSLPSVLADGDGLQQAAEARLDNPLSSVADRFLGVQRGEVVDTLNSLCHLLGKTNNEASDSPPSENTLRTMDFQSVASEGRDRRTKSPSYSERPTAEQLQTSARNLAEAMGLSVASQDPSTAALVINPHFGAARCEVEVKGYPPDAKTPGLYGATTVKSNSRVTIDSPGVGFATVAAGNKKAESTQTSGFLSGLFSKSKSIAHGNSLANEFMDVAIHPEHGSIAAVHAGQQRGNRFSWQLSLFDQQSQERYSQMECKKLRILESNVTRGIIETTGKLLLDSQAVADFTIRYTLRRGTRWIEIAVEIGSLTTLRPEPWQHYLCGRIAWATDALSVRPLVRDKRHRARGKRLEAPLGVIVDEGDRKLQICSYGMPAHRRVDGQHLDTLLAVHGESRRSFQLAYGFDVPAAVRSARQMLTPPAVVAIEPLSAAPTRQWLVDVDSPKVVITQFKLLGNCRVQATVVETGGQPTKTKLQCFCDILSATRSGDQHQYPVENGAVTLSLAGHEALVIELQFAASEPS